MISIGKKIATIYPTENSNRKRNMYSEKINTKY